MTRRTFCRALVAGIVAGVLYGLSEDEDEPPTERRARCPAHVKSPTTS